MARCERTAGDLGIADRVVFAGMKQNHDIPAYLRASAILINLIDRHEDNGSMKLLEYMSSGGAVIVNSPSAFGFPLTNRVNCLLVNAAEPEEIAGAVETLLGDEGLRRTIGENARAFVLSRFSWRRTAEVLLSVIEEARAHA